MARPPTPRDIAALSAYLDAGTAKAAAGQLAVTSGTLRRRLAALHAKTGSENTAQSIYALRHEIEAYRGER